MVIIDGKYKKSPLPTIMAKREIDKGTREFKIWVSYFYDVQNLIKLGNYHGYSIIYKDLDSWYEVTMKALDF